MGKPLNKEQLKLTATFYNNLAVGSALGGVLIPLFGLYRDLPLGALFAPFLTFPPPPPDERIAAASITAFVAFGVAWIFRRVANRVAGYVEED
jgi:hypothetical protein